MKMVVQQRFLVSFMVDARGGAMRGCRHSGVRVIIPPRKAAAPTRITCRYLKKDKLVHAPPLMEGEALASRILEMGPAGARFLGPVILEVPHFASLRGKEREIVILRSDNGETWREHTLEATEEAVQEVLNESFDGEELKQLEDLNTNRITRILTTDFPQYFAIVTRIRQEVHAIGPDGGMVSSTVVPQVQAVFPQGALTKKIKVGLQAQPISPELAAKLLGNRVAVSPIVTVEPRRRKFHKPITLTLPVPQAASKGMINQYSGDAPTLRLLCSITGGTTRAQWEDVTGSTPLTFVNDCVSFTTTVSARFWLMDCTNIPEATRMATELYREAIHVPFMSKFAVFAKRHQLEEARVRVFCMTDDREDKTLETQEQFREVAKSRDVEVLEGKPQYLEFAGNLVPITKSGDQLSFNFYAFRENRLPFTVRVKDLHTESVGRIAFMRQPKVGRGDAPQNPICNLNIALPETIQPEPAPSEPDLLSLEKKYTFLSISKADTIHKADLRFSDISNMLNSDWVSLAKELDINESDINIIKCEYAENAPQQALVMLRLWMQTAGNKATGNTLEKALRRINRLDIVNQCIFNLEPVTDDKERAVAKAQIDTSVIADSPHVSRKDGGGPLNRDASMDVSYDEHDLMKDAESAEEDEDNNKSYQGKTISQAGDLSPTYEREEKKYAGEEKIVAEEKIIAHEADKNLKSQFTQDDVDSFLKDSEGAFDKKFNEIIKEKYVEQVPTEYLDKEVVVEESFIKTVADRSREEPTIENVKVITKESFKQEPEQLMFSSTDKDSVPEKDIVQTTVTTKRSTFEDGSHSIITTKTTERRSFIIGDDDSDSEAVQEKIVVEKRTDSADASPFDPTSKSAMLQKLGEELGKLDDKLEATFKEKRRTEQPDEDEFTQTSIDKMTGGSAPTTDVARTTDTARPPTTTSSSAGGDAAAQQQIGTNEGPAPATTKTDDAKAPGKKDGATADSADNFILANPYARFEDGAGAGENNMTDLADDTEELADPVVLASSYSSTPTEVDIIEHLTFVVGEDLSSTHNEEVCYSTESTDARGQEEVNTDDYAIDYVLDNQDDHKREQLLLERKLQEFEQLNNSDKQELLKEEQNSPFQAELWPHHQGEVQQGEELYNDVDNYDSDREDNTDAADVDQQETESISPVPAVNNFNEAGHHNYENYNEEEEHVYENVGPAAENFYEDISPAEHVYENVAAFAVDSQDKWEDKETYDSNSDDDLAPGNDEIFSATAPEHSNTSAAENESGVSQMEQDEEQQIEDDDHQSNDFDSNLIDADLNITASSSEETKPSGTTTSEQTKPAGTTTSEQTKPSGTTTSEQTEPSGTTTSGQIESSVTATSEQSKPTVTATKKSDFIPSDDGDSDAEANNSLQYEKQLSYSENGATLTKTEQFDS